MKPTGETTGDGRKPGDRIRAIRHSLLCFGDGLLGLIPLLGLPFSLLALYHGRRARQLAGGEWNPAEAYLRAGCGLAPLTFVSTGVFLALALLIIPALLREFSGCSTGFT